ncbi:hypothetical protein PM082_016622 [Marasmius tenuissimus]|nr:hypothetical protein PM082_016622 [Marasmius tenuissimus]
MTCPLMSYSLGLKITIVSRIEGALEVVFALVAVEDFLKMKYTISPKFMTDAYHSKPSTRTWEPTRRSPDEARSQDRPNPEPPYTADCTASPLDQNILQVIIRASNRLVAGRRPQLLPGYPHPVRLSFSSTHRTDSCAVSVHKVCSKMGNVCRSTGSINRPFYWVNSQLLPTLFRNVSGSRCSSAVSQLSSFEDQRISHPYTQRVIQTTSRGRAVFSVLSFCSSMNRVLVGLEGTSTASTPPHSEAWTRDLWGDDVSYAVLN